MGMYPPTLSFTVVYDTALKYSWHGRPSMVKLFCEGTTGGRLQFNSILYEEKGEILMYSILKVCNTVIFTQMHAVP